MQKQGNNHPKRGGKKNGNGNGRRLIITADGLIESISSPSKAAQLNRAYLHLTGNGQ